MALLIAGTTSSGGDAPPQPDAFFIQDDLSVQGSACIGAACVNSVPGMYGSAGRNMLHFINNGAATFKFQNTSDSTEWNFGSRNAGDFFVAFGPGLPLEYLFDPNGNLTIAGTLTQNSDRDTKTEIEPVDGRALLDRLAALPISTWRFKADPAAVRHMGPMAQDFAAAFGLGPDERHIAPVDVGGVSLAAIQALLRETDALHERLSAIEAALAAAQH